MVRRGLVPSRETARRLIAERQVLVDGSFAEKPARMVDAGQAIVFVNPPPPYVSRAGLKLAGALDEFAIDPSDLVCLDAGSSTGGFTDCLLQRGAKSVVAVDVGTNQLHEKIRADGRVDVREQTDVRSLQPSEFSSLFDLIVGDLSFISLRLVLPSLRPLMADGARMVMLVKPQFEAGRVEASKAKGVITDPEIWRRALTEVLDSAADLGLSADGIVPSSIQGGQGNVEFVVLLTAESLTIGANGRSKGDTCEERADPGSGRGGLMSIDEGDNYTGRSQLVDLAIDRVVTDLEQRQEP